MVEGVTAWLRQLQGNAPVEVKQGAGCPVPLLYSTLYRLCQVAIQGIPCVLAEDKHSMRLTPVMIRKHMQGLSSLAGRHAIYVDGKIAAQDARRLFAQGVSFLGGNGNLYLPLMGLRLMGFPKPAPQCTALGIPAQLLVLGALHHRLPSLLTYQAALALLPYSQGSVHTAFAQLQQTGLCQQLSGREVRLAWVETGRALWERALPFLSNPCKRTLEADFLPEGLPWVSAGETALAAQTMLASPYMPTYAIDLRRYSRERSASFLAGEPEEPCLLQLWLYPPDWLGAGHVDALSLWLTLCHTQDERLQQALGQLLDTFPW